ncbi:MAG: GDP-mannose 4,6-dehydratase [Gemmatimonadaceae bacterium]
MRVSTALITGVTGQDGRYLSALLLDKGYRVVGIARRLPEEPLPAEVDLRLVDVRDAEAMGRLVAGVGAAEVYHLAAESSVEQSWHDPAHAEHARAAVEAVLGSVHRGVSSPRVVLACSSEVFGAPVGSPQNEQTSAAPLSPYGAGKAAVLAAGREARVRDHLHVSSAILYNHESPRRPPRFVTRKVTQAVAAIAAGRQREVRLGNLAAVRDWGFAGDYVEAMWRMLQSDTADDYVIGTGVARTVEELCGTAFETLHLDYRDYTVSDPALFRPIDPIALVADASLARARLGWVPRKPFAEMIREMVHADVARLGRGDAC